MSQIHNYTCSAEDGCNKTFAKFVDLKKHEAAHSPDGYMCSWPGCDFATLMKTSYDIHYAKHMGEKRHICRHNGCDYKTHDPALLTRHRTKRHGYVPLARGRGAPSATGSGRTQSASSSPQPQAQPPALISSFQSLPQPPTPFHQYQYQSTQFQPQPPQPAQPAQFQPQPAQFQPQPAQFQPQPAQFQPQPAQPAHFQPQFQPQQPTQLQLQPPQPAQLQPQPPQPQPIQFLLHSIQFQPPPAVYDQSLGVLYGPSNTVDEYAIYTGPAKASHGWTEGCMCPELMQRRPSEILESEYFRF
ncbi:hypothetical protein P692DRAFT_20821157 [Suillus brevipes Sb2]|nr:hypothetical protein P692DRAFT_20821157 [Suillus brevipes Sb2]